MGIKIGTDSINDIKLGTTQVDKVMLNGKNLFDPNVQAITELPVGRNNITKTVITNGIRLTLTSALPSASAYDALVFIVGEVSDYIGKTLTFSATTSPSSSNTTRTYIGTCDASGSNRQAKDSTVHSDVNLSWTVEDDGNPYIMLAMYATNSHASEAGDYMDYLNPQLEVGSTPTTYEPYIGEVTLWQKSS